MPTKTLKHVEYSQGGSMERAIQDSVRYLSLHLVNRLHYSCYCLPKSDLKASWALGRSLPVTGCSLLASHLDRQSSKVLSQCGSAHFAKHLAWEKGRICFSSQSSSAVWCKQGAQSGAGPGWASAMVCSSKMRWVWAQMAWKGLMCSYSISRVWRTQPCRVHKSIHE